MKQTYRSTGAFAIAWVWMAFAAFNVWDLTAHYTGKSTLVAAAVLAVITVVVYITGLRPATVFTEEALRVRNPLRTIVAPWSAVGEARASHAISVEYGEGHQMRLWTPMASSRERAKAQRQAVPKQARSRGEQLAAEALAGKTHADWVAEQITERAQAARRATRERGQVSVRWAPDSLVAVGLALVMIVVAVVG
ncbi:PH domain-containing protein [Thermoactinospora rubra]|uniref:PH domain-containing protein n=1 Tax=Thermoactinospora rubra TaxID=1088767 RepID=UPI000A11CD45|nr:PH domain-containing protein [Thermoactinospora rubra]